MTRISAVIFDVDGTLTDGKINIGPNGEVFKSFSVKDGIALKHLMPEHHMVPIILTARSSTIVDCRCKELGIQYIYQGCADKGKQMREIAKMLNLIEHDGIIKGLAYMGDDVMDLPGMRICEIIGCPADADKRVLSVSNFISTKNGGEGAAREFVEWLIENGYC